MLSRSGVLAAVLIISCFVRGQAVPSMKSKGAQAHVKAPAAGKIVVPDILYEKYKLKNGLEVILSENHRLPIVAVNLWYHVGPLNEEPGRSGLAHMFEHLMFEGSKHVEGTGHFKYLQAAGGTAINATTEFDRTNYFETVPSNELEKALWLESDRMGFFLDSLDDAKLTTQKDVVRNERRQRTDNEPYGVADEELFHALFPPEHPYYGHVTGTHADIEAAQLDDVRSFFSRYYVPNNASLAIVGDIDKSRAKALIEKYFGPLPAGAPVPPLKIKTPPVTSERRVVVTDKVDLPRVYMAWITDPMYKPGDAAEHILSRIFGTGSSKSGRMYQHLDRKSVV